MGVLHGQHTFTDSSFRRAGLLVVFCEPCEDGNAEEFLHELQPSLHFQSLGVVLPPVSAAEPWPNIGIWLS